MPVESPEHEVVRREDSLELRRYRPHLIASEESNAAARLPTKMRANSAVVTLSAAK